MKQMLLLAPIRGITEKIYRNLFSKHFGGFDYAVAPFINGFRQNNIDKKILKEFNLKNDLLLTIPQILSKDPMEFISLANALFDMGYSEINWNLGCPHPVVVTKKKGSGLLPYPDLIDAFLDKVLPLMKGKISIKMRLGYESADEIFKLIPILNRYPIAQIIIHARTGKQMYSGITNKDAFEKCIPLIKHSLIYNGDIFSIEDFNQLSSRFKTVHQWMIGRGALRNPFLLQEINGKNLSSFENKIKKIRLFHDELYEEYCKILSGAAHILDKMTGHWEYLSEFFPQGSQFYKKIKKVKNLGEYQEKLKMIF